MQTKDKYGHLCIILLSGITLGLISGATGSLGIYYDAADAAKPLMLSTLTPAIALGLTGMIGIIMCLCE
jgi:hypothetical protein